MNNYQYASKGSNWVKFTNGLIIQWGSSSANPVTFNIPFSSANRMVTALPYNESHNNNLTLVSITTTNFTWGYGGGGVNWIAVGF